MSRKTKKAELTLAQDQAAPFLFDEDCLPMRNDIVAAVAAGRYKHTGARLLDNETKALRMVELLMAGWGLKRIAREMNVAKASVKAARGVLIERGELAPFKQRVIAIYEDIIEVGAANYLDGLERGLVAPSQIPVGLGIISDKRALALGEPTSIGVSGQVGLERSSLSVEALNSWVKGLPVDGQSTVSTANSPDLSKLKPVVARLVAHSPPLSSLPSQPAGPGQVAAALTGTDPAGTGAGGGSVPPEAPNYPTQCPALNSS